MNIIIKRDGIDVTNDWSIAANPSGVSGPWTGTKYSISAITTTSASVIFTATRANWSN